MKRVKREKAPARAMELMTLPAPLPEESKSGDSGMTLGLVAGVLGLNGVAFLVGRM